MDKRNDSVEKIDEVMLPGFRFHPTDEELVGFYLRRKIQHRPLSIELIKQLDIYKYDPWDLPKLATTGEKEWYFYCPRDRKYRNSARPNRVTGAGFWKATGTDRPIYSSESSKCIGLKKSLVFYKGRAAKGIKTDWMMHEFRLPSMNESGPAKRYMDRDIPANDAWAICRIFKKANSSAQRALSHSWVSPILPETTTTTTTSDMQNEHFHGTNNIFSSDNNSLTTKTSSVIQFGDSSEVQQSSIASFSPLDPTFPYKSISQMFTDLSQVSTSKADLHTIYPLPFPTTQTTHEPSKCSTNDASSLLLNMSSSVFGDFGKSAKILDYGVSISQEQCSNLLMALPQDMRRNFGHQQDHMTSTIASDHGNVVAQKDEQWESMQSLGIPINFPVNIADAWKSNLIWDSPSPCPSDISTTYSTNKCYT